MYYPGSLYKICLALWFTNDIKFGNRPKLYISMQHVIFSCMAFSEVFDNLIACFRLTIFTHFLFVCFVLFLVFVLFCFVF